MKRNLIKAMVLGLLVLLLLTMSLMAACAKPAPSPTLSPSPSPKPSPAAKAASREGWPKSLAFVGGSAGSGYYAVNTAMAALATKYLGISAAPLAVPGGGFAMAKAVVAREGEFGVADDFTIPLGYFGDKPWDSPQPLRVFIQGSISPLNWIVLASSNIKSWSDAKGKRVMVMSPASQICMAVNPVVFQAYGLDIKKDCIDLPMQGVVATCAALKEGTTDVGSFPAAAPTSAVLELADAKPIRMLPITKPQLDEICAKLPFLHPTTIRGGIYKGVDKDVSTVGYLLYAFTRADVPDDLVYELTKAIYEHLSEFGSYHPLAADFSPEQCNLVNAPHHAGAIKYYKEIGVWSNEHDAKVKAWLKQMGQSK